MGQGADGRDYLSAVDGTIILGNEGDLGGLAALCADRIVHLAGARIVAAGATVGLASIAARLAAGRLVLEALFSVESLFTRGEDEFGAAVSANQSLVFVHGKVSLR